VSALYDVNNNVLYFTVNKTAGNFNVSWYSDPARTTLIESLSYGGGGLTDSYPYMYGIQAVDAVGDAGDWCSGSVANLWLGNTTLGYVANGWFNTTNLLDGLSYNATVLLTNTTIPSGSINVQISPDGSTWTDLGNLAGGYEAIDLRALGLTDVILNYSIVDGITTPRIYQTRLIHEGPGAGATVAGVTDATPWLAIGIILALSMILLADRLRK
jgi:hypothetical protein